MATMSRQQKKAAIDLAWADYRAAAQQIDRSTPWDQYLAADEKAWRRYLATEREILAAPEPKAA